MHFLSRLGGSPGTKRLDVFPRTIIDPRGGAVIFFCVFLDTLERIIRERQGYQAFL